MDPQAGAQAIVGRETELDHLDRALEALDRGGGTCLTVEGEPGIGKTRLLEELRARAGERGHLVLSGAAAEFERELPFSVFVDALNAYVAGQQLSEQPGWSPDLERELAQLLPALRGPGEQPGVLADERYRAHRAMRRLLELIATERALVLELDDLHWADHASLELIAALVRRPPAAPVLLALGFRPGPAAEQLSGPLAAARAERFELGQLSESEATHLLAGIDSGSVAAIFRHAGGNPFYLQQLGRSDAEHGPAPDPGESSDGQIPPAVAATIATELELLPDRARVFLDSAAVVGEPFEPQLAANVAQLSLEEGLEALDELLACDLVRPTAAPARFRFRHPLVRRGVYQATRGGWRLAAHARAAAALAGRGAGPAERAHHVEQSASRGDDEAIELLLSAGRSAGARAPGAALRWFEAALRLLPGGDVERRMGIWLALASAHRSLGQLVDCRAALLEAIELLPADASIPRVRLTAACAAVEHWQGMHEEATRRLFRAWEEVAGEATPEATSLQIELAIDGLYEHDFEQNFHMGSGALSTARTLGDPSLIVTAASALALGQAASGQVAAARAHRAEALAQIERMSDAELVDRLEMFVYLGRAETHLEHYDDAIAHAQRAVSIARAIAAGRPVVALLLLQPYPMQMRGRIAESTEVAETAVEVARVLAIPHMLFWALHELAWARYYAGDLDGTIEAAEESVHLGGRMAAGTMPSARGGAGWALAVARFELGDEAGGLSLMRDLAGEDMESWAPVDRNFSREQLALAELAAGNLEAAAAIARRAEEAAAALPLQMPAMLAARTRAAVQLAGGDSAGALAAAQSAVAAGTAIGARLQVASSSCVVGRALGELGERGRAIEVLREAERELDGCASARMRDEARRELRRLGARSETRGRAPAGHSGLEALTKRELEVSELVTDRMTNKEIAARLFLSERTVESHVRNVFHKLGVSSRVELARLVERERAAQRPAPAE